MLFSEFVKCLEEIEKTSKRLEMFEILSNLFKKLKPGEFSKAIYFCEERLKPSYEGVEIGMAEKMLEKALSLSNGVSLKKVSDLHKKLGDLGLVAEQLSGKSAKLVKSEALTLSEVYDTLLKVAKISGEGTVEQKVSLVAGLLSKANNLEAKYIARFINGRLRLGIGDPTIMDSLSMAKKGDRSLREAIEHAYNLCSDLGLVAETLFEKGEVALGKFKVVPGKPIRMAAAERLSSSKEIIEKIGKCAVDTKFDGFRIQCHFDGKEIKMFSRNLENMTHMFPDLIEAVKREIKVKDIIFEGEAITYNEDTGELYPFQVTIQRKRKHNIEEKKEELPLKMFVFDILYLNGEDILSKPFVERRKILEHVFSKGEKIVPSKLIITDDSKVAEMFFDESISSGLEGVIFKRLDAPYSAGARNFNWIKLKRSYKGELSDTVDLVILGYFKGKGMRVSLGIGAILGGVYDEKEDTFKTLAKIGSGFSEENWKRLKKDLDEISVKNRPARIDSILVPDVWVTPKYVITVRADEITRSPMHTAGKDKDNIGYALRFPRAEGYIRSDKSPEEATTTKEIEEMFKIQKSKKLIE